MRRFDGDKSDLYFALASSCLIVVMLGYSVLKKGFQEKSICLELVYMRDLKKIQGVSLQGVNISHKEVIFHPLHLFSFTLSKCTL